MKWATDQQILDYIAKHPGVRRFELMKALGIGYRRLKTFERVNRKKLTTVHHMVPRKDGTVGSMCIATTFKIYGPEDELDEGDLKAAGKMLEVEEAEKEIA